MIRVEVFSASGGVSNVSKIPQWSLPASLDFAVELCLGALSFDVLNLKQKLF